MKISKFAADEIIYLYGHMRMRMPQIFRRPLGYFLYITGNCNLDCTYCWQRDQDANPARLANSTNSPLTVEEWVRIVESLPPRCFLGVSGGEATISPAFRPIVRAAGRRPVTVNTNGVSLRDEDIELLVRPPVRNVSISLDGFEEVHDRSRNRAGLFQRTTRNIRRLVEARSGRDSPAVTIKTVLTDDNVAGLPEFRRFCERELGADTLNLSFQKTGDHYQYSLLYHRDLATLWRTGAARLHGYADPQGVRDTLAAMLAENRRSRCQVVIYPRLRTAGQLDDFLRNGGEGVYRPCALPLAMVTVLPDGQVIPCQSFALGNLRDFDYNIAAVLNDSPYRAFCRSLAGFEAGLPKACSVCCFAKVR